MSAPRFYRVTFADDNTSVRMVGGTPTAAFKRACRLLGRSERSIAVVNAD